MLFHHQVAVQSYSMKRACSLALPMKEIMNLTLLLWYVAISSFLLYLAVCLALK